MCMCALCAWDPVPESRVRWGALVAKERQDEGGWM